MTSLDDIRRVNGELSDPVVREACSRLSEALWRHIGDKTMWSYKALSRLLEVAPNDPLLQRCITLLASRSSAKLLDMHFLYFDPRDPESAGEAIADENVVAAYRDGYLVDPEDGQEIKDFEKALVPFFVISEEVEGHGTDH